MALSYDFDVVGAQPEGPEGGFAERPTAADNAKGIAMFRDANTVAALQKADPVVRAFFAESGFAFRTHNSGAPPGRFPARDEEARLAIVRRLSANLGTHNLRGANWGGFDFQAFMAALSAAEPIDAQLLAPIGGEDRSLRAELLAARIASRQRRGRRQIALGGLLLGVILLGYVATQMLPG